MCKIHAIHFGNWGDGEAREAEGDKEDKVEIITNSAQCPMPHAQCPMPQSP
ncbi:histidine kinase [Nostoc linckia]|uniref:histidine kinase n=1 Tax=Nostoc linckia TaxID=92942 RepID=UPI001FD3A763|nr:histidine kinase [Nostoc linckia]